MDCRRAGHLLSRRCADSDPTSSQASRSSAASAPRRADRRSSRSSGRATPPARAGASTSARRHAHLRDHARTARTSSSIPATRSTPTARSTPTEAAGRRIWKNLVTDGKAKVAETLDEFRGNYEYNLLDENVRAFNAEVPMFAQWDDHEVTNNWSPAKSLGAPRPARYAENRVAAARARARRALPRIHADPPIPAERGRIYRKIAYGPLLDVFFLDMRSYRGPNTANTQATDGPETVFLGREQLAWLKRELSPRARPGR